MKMSDESRSNQENPAFRDVYLRATADSLAIGIGGGSALMRALFPASVGRSEQTSLDGQGLGLGQVQRNQDQPRSVRSRREERKGLRATRSLFLALTRVRQPSFQGCGASAFRRLRDYVRSLFS